MQPTHTILPRPQEHLKSKQTAIYSDTFRRYGKVPTTTKQTGHDGMTLPQPQEHLRWDKNTTPDMTLSGPQTRRGADTCARRFVKALPQGTHRGAQLRRRRRAQRQPALAKRHLCRHLDIGADLTKHRAEREQRQCHPPTCCRAQPRVSRRRT